MVLLFKSINKICKINQTTQRSVSARFYKSLLRAYNPLLFSNALPEALVAAKRADEVSAPAGGHRLLHDTDGAIATT